MADTHEETPVVLTDAPVDEADELVEEMAATTTIDALFEVVTDVTETIFEDVITVSLQGNPVATHVELVALSQEVVRLLFILKGQLIERLAKRGDEIHKTGFQLTRQIINDEAEEY